VVALVAMKTKYRNTLNVEDDLFYSLSYIEPRISLVFLTANRLSRRIDSSARCVIKSCFQYFYFCSMHVQQLSLWRSCTVGGPSGVAAIWTFWIYPGAADSEGEAKVGLKRYSVENILYFQNILSTKFFAFFFYLSFLNSNCFSS